MCEKDKWEIYIGTSLYHQLSGSVASIEMELGPGEVHSFIRAGSR